MSTSTRAHRFIFIAALVVAGGIAAPTANAQVSISTQFSNEKLILAGVSIAVEPENPQPFERVTITLSSVRIDLSSATISWSRNGKKIESASGKRSITFTVGGGGVRERIGFTIKAPYGGVVSEEIVLTPTVVSLVWEANGYTPKLYRGKALNSWGASVRVIALPEFVTSRGTLIDPATLVYRWKSDTDNITQQSGVGRQSVTIPPAMFGRSSVVNVEVSTKDGSRVGAGYIVLPEARMPEVVVYELHPLLGIRYEQAIVNRAVFEQDEVVLVSEPYYFSTTNREGGITYEWRQGGRLVSGGPFLYLTKKEKGAAKERFVFDVMLMNTRELLEQTNTSGTVIF